MKNQNSLDTICASLAYAIGIDPPACAAPRHPDLSDFIDRFFDGEKADRIVMFNPDAIAQWVYEKYFDLCHELKENTDIAVPLATVVPPVTPVCYATMYTGAQPAVHGIQVYEKPVLTIDTFFDALIRAGKKPAIIAGPQTSMGNIYLDRDMDYYRLKTTDEVNACASELILRDEYDFIAVYNPNYDAMMHKTGPESIASLSELRCNVHTFGVISHLIRRNWKHHNTLLGFAMDHGCHEIDGGCGSHGLDMEEDINIVHFYKGFRKESTDR